MAERRGTQERPVLAEARYVADLEAAALRLRDALRGLLERESDAARAAAWDALARHRRLTSGAEISRSSSGTGTRGSVVALFPGGDHGRAHPHGGAHRGSVAVGAAAREEPSCD